MLGSFLKSAISTDFAKNADSRKDPSNFAIFLRFRRWGGCQNHENREKMRTQGRIQCVTAKNTRYNACYSVKTAHLGRVTLRKQCVTAQKHALQLVLLCENSSSGSCYSAKTVRYSLKKCVTTRVTLRKKCVTAFSLKIKIKYLSF